MLARLRAEQQSRVVADEAERVDERAGPELVGDDHRRRVHGVRARCASTSSASATSASAIASPPAARISVLKMSWLERDEDRTAEAFRDDERRDRRDRDRRDRRDAEAGDDRRHRERQLDAQERLRAREAHPPRRLERVGRHARGAPRSCSGRGSAACTTTSAISTVVTRQARDRDEQLEEREARDRVEEVGEERRSAGRSRR